MVAIKLLVFVAIVAAVSAQGYGGHEHGHGHEEHHHPAHYNFAYFVHDPHTHDIKEQHENRHGDKVDGHYSLYEPDGTKRVVHYTADHHGGFHAHVEHEGHAQHPAHHGHGHATSHIKFHRHY